MYVQVFEKPLDVLTVLLVITVVLVLQPVRSEITRLDIEVVRRTQRRDVTYVLFLVVPIVHCLIFYRDVDQ